MSADSVVTVSLVGTKVFAVRGEKGVILVDAGVPETKDKILGGLAKEGIKPEEISLIIITHVHFDHVGSLAQLKKATGASVAVHKAEKDLLEKGLNAEIKPISTKGKILFSVIPKNQTLEGVEADIILDEEMDLSDFGVKGKVISTPGHTPGSVSIILEDGNAIIGDMIMGGLIFADKPGMPMFAVSQEEVRKSIKKVLDYNPKRIHTAHGGPFDGELIREKFGGGSKR